MPLLEIVSIEYLKITFEPNYRFCYYVYLLYNIISRYNMYLRKQSNSHLRQLTQ